MDFAAAVEELEEAVTKAAEEVPQNLIEFRKCFVGRVETSWTSVGIDYYTEQTSAGAADMSSE